MLQAEWVQHLVLERAVINKTPLFFLYFIHCFTYIGHRLWQGFDYDKARRDLEVPDNFDVVAMIAIGKRGPRNQLPPQLQEREYPNDRKPLKEIVMVGRFSI